MSFYVLDICFLWRNINFSILSKYFYNFKVPYDYIPIGRRQQEVSKGPAYPSDVNLIYEKLFPARRKWVD